MESLVNLQGAFEGRRVFVTGHTGFKGSWLCQWLLGLGAQVCGYSLAPDTAPSLFAQLGLAKRLKHHVGDVRDAEALCAAIREFQPDYVFHLAAQPLVRRSYSEPAQTFEVNVMGTVHVLEALRALNSPCAAVMVTTDKVYENPETGCAFAEGDRLGGSDPYSASKAAAELAIHSYRKSFFSDSDCPVALASARAGNVIGGGDWATDRIVPDCIRALIRREPIQVRNPQAIRPWQHVLEPLSGYLLLAQKLSRAGGGGKLADAFNFGPILASSQPVAALVQELLKHWEGSWVVHSDPKAPHESGKLQLSTSKALNNLGWQPRWNFNTTIEKTALWYRDVERGCDPLELTNRQIAEYSSCVAADGVASLCEAGPPPVELTPPPSSG